MEEPSNPGGGGGHSGGRSVVSAGGGGVASLGGESSVDDLDELWPSQPSAAAAAAMLAQIWVENPASSSRFTLGLGWLDLDPKIWVVIIHFDGVDNLERKLGRDDITYMNLVALIETQGYSIRDSIYCRQLEGMHVLIENNAKIYELSDLFDSSKVLNLTMKRGRAIVAKKGKAAQTMESADDAYMAEEDDGCDDSLYFDMGEEDFARMEEIRRKDDMEIVEKIGEMRKKIEDPMLHCEGDTDIEDLHVTLTPESTPAQAPPKAPAPARHAAPPQAARQASPRQAPPQAPQPATRQAAPRQAPPQAPQPTPRQAAPRQAFVPPRTIAQDDGQGGEAGPAYKKSRTWSYFNCGYVGPQGEAGSSDN
ncbi:hypothetical protein ACQ4PT_036739 [Festuca glaucescens]